MSNEQGIRITFFNKITELHLTHSCLQCLIWMALNVSHLVLKALAPSVGKIRRTLQRNRTSRPSHLRAFVKCKKQLPKGGNELANAGGQVLLKPEDIKHASGASISC